MSVTPTRAGDEVWIKGENQGTMEVPGQRHSTVFLANSLVHDVIPDRLTVVVNFRYQVTSDGWRTYAIMHISDEFQIACLLFKARGASWG